MMQTFIDLIWDCPNVRQDEIDHLFRPDVPITPHLGPADDVPYVCNRGYVRISYWSDQHCYIENIPN